MEGKVTVRMEAKVTVRMEGKVRDDTLDVPGEVLGAKDANICTVTHPTASVYRGSLTHGR